MDNIKKFEDFLDRMQGLLNEAKKQGHIIVRVEDLENAFPELKESEDERIRKALIEMVHDTTGDELWVDYNVHKEDALAWLEKQEGCEYIKKDWLEHIKQSWYKEGFIDGKYSGGTSKEWTINDAAIFKEIIDFLENGTAKLQHDLTKYANWLKIQFTPIEKQGKQFSVDKLESKFKVGDFIVNDYCMGKVIELTGDAYLLDTGQGIPFSCEHNAHIWTIQDAKDGDVLASELCDSIILFKGINDDNNIDFYCDYDFSEIDLPGDRFSVNNGQHYGNVEDSKDFHPATKEQRDFLFTKMKDASYEWDDEKKELKLLITNGGDFEAENCEQNPTDEEMKELLRTEYEKGRADAIAEMQVAWGEEDERMCQETIDWFEKKCFHYALESEDPARESIKWLKSLKQKIGGKFMETPEKIYFGTQQNTANPFSGLTHKCADTDIEYTRTDAFIEKATWWLSKHFYDEEYQSIDNEGTWIDADELIEDFKKYMKGE